MLAWMLLMLMRVRMLVLVLVRVLIDNRLGLRRRRSMRRLLMLLVEVIVATIDGRMLRWLVNIGRVVYLRLQVVGLVNVGIFARTASTLAILDVLELDALGFVWVEAALFGATVNMADGAAGHARLVEDFFVREAVDLEG